MITPKDIESKVFTKSIRGYNDVEVDDFLDKIIVDMKNLIKENQSLRLEIENLNGEIEKQKKSQSSVIGTLESAKQLMQDISESAERRAEIIIKNAKLDAESITKEAKDSVKKLNQDTENIQERAKIFRGKYRDLLQKELDSLDNSELEIFNSLNVDDIEVDMNDIVPEQEREEPAHLEIEDIFGTPEDDVKDKDDLAMNRDTKVVGSVNVAPRKTVALDSSDIDEMLKKEGITLAKK